MPLLMLPVSGGAGLFLPRPRQYPLSIPYPDHAVERSTAWFFFAEKEGPTPLRDANPSSREDYVLAAETISFSSQFRMGLESHCCCFPVQRLSLTAHFSLAPRRRLPSQSRSAPRAQASGQTRSAYLMREGSLLTLSQSLSVPMSGEPMA